MMTLVLVAYDVNTETCRRPPPAPPDCQDLLRLRSAGAELGVRVLGRSCDVGKARSAVFAEYDSERTASGSITWATTGEAASSITGQKSPTIREGPLIL